MTEKSGPNLLCLTFASTDRHRAQRTENRAKTSPHGSPNTFRHQALGSVPTWPPPVPLRCLAIPAVPAINCCISGGISGGRGRTCSASGGRPQSSMWLRASAGRGPDCGGRPGTRVVQIDAKRQKTRSKAGPETAIKSLIRPGRVPVAGAKQAVARTASNNKVASSRRAVLHRRGGGVKDTEQRTAASKFCTRRLADCNTLQFPVHAFTYSPLHSISSAPPNHVRPPLSVVLSL